MAPRLLFLDCLREKFGKKDTLFFKKSKFFRIQKNGGGKKTKKNENFLFFRLLFSKRGIVY